MDNMDVIDIELWVIPQQPWTTACRKQFAWHYVAFCVEYIDNIMEFITLKGWIKKGTTKSVVISICDAFLSMTQLYKQAKYFDILVLSITNTHQD